MSTDRLRAAVPTTTPAGAAPLVSDSSNVLAEPPDMRLTGACSNHDVGARLDKGLYQKRRILPRSEGPERGRESPLRLPMGAIQAATLATLRDAACALTCREVRACVEERLRRPVSQDTISSFLSVACRSAEEPVQRVGRGLYRTTE